MITVRDLYEVVADETLADFQVVAYFGDYRVSLTSQYIENSILYLLNEETDDNKWNAEGLKWFIDNEALDDSWKPVHAIDASPFVECEVRIVDGYYDSPESVFYYITSITVSGDEIVLKLSLENETPEQETQWAVTLNSSLDAINEVVQGTASAVEKYLVKKINEYMNVGVPDAVNVTVDDLNEDFIDGGFGVLVENYDGKDNFAEIYATEVELEEIIRLDSDGNPIKSKEVA